MIEKKTLNFGKQYFFLIPQTNLKYIFWLILKLIGLYFLSNCNFIFTYIIKIKFIIFYLMYYYLFQNLFVNKIVFIIEKKE